MTQLPSETLTPYAPLPVRARGTLEIFDTAFKLFRRYAGVLLAWSVLSSIINLIPIFGLLTYIFTMPLLFGAVSCVIAAAVRGQKVTFKQVWGFTKPRYGALLGVLILAVILMGVVMFALMFGVTLIVILFVSGAASFGWFATGVAWIVGTIAGLIGSSFLLAVLMGWFNLAPVIACLEDANRGSNALSRAWSLLSGNWRKACGVATILALATLAALVIIGGFTAFFFYGGWDKFIGADTDFFSGLAVSGVLTVFFVVWAPLQAVVGAVFYLDLRTRKEALDLEWTNYAAKPEAEAGAPSEQAQTSPSYSPAQPAPASMSGPSYAPGSSLPAQPPAPTTATQLPPTPQAPIFAAQATAPIQQQQPTPPMPVELSPAPDSFAAFAAQVETEPAPQSTPSAPPVAVNIEKAPAPVDAQIVAPPSVPPVAVQAVPPPPPVVQPVVVQPEPVVSAPAPTSIPVPPPVPSEAVAPQSSVTPSFGGPVTPPPAPSLVPPPVPVAPEPAVASSPAREPEPEGEVTSSFAPRRFRRAASEDDDYPSSFGGSR